MQKRIEMQVYVFRLNFSLKVTTKKDRDRKHRYANETLHFSVICW